MRTVCWQKEMRDQESKLDPRPQDAVLDYTIERIRLAEARDFVLRYEWLGTVGRPIAKYGARNAQGELVAVALFGLSGGTLSRNICGEKHKAKAICLARGACAHWAHPHTASWFISKVTAMAHKDFGWNIFYGYSDPDAGEIGTVYQACGWIYIGQGVGRAAGKPRTFFKMPNGKVVEERWLRHHHLTENEVLKAGWTVIHASPKHKYVHFEGNKVERKLLMAALRYPPQQYPEKKP